MDWHKGIKTYLVVVAYLIIQVAYYYNMIDLPTKEGLVQILVPTGVATIAAKLNRLQKTTENAKQAGPVNS